MKPLASFLFILTVAFLPASAQQTAVQLFAGRTAPAAQNADVLSRSYRSGVTFGFGAGVALTPRLRAEATTSYQRYSLRPPSAVLENNGLDGAGARYESSGFHNRLAVEVNVQYTLQPSTGLQPYVLGGLAQQYVFADAVHIRGDRAAMQTEATREFVTGLQVGGGMQAHMSDRILLFAEAVYQFHDDGSHTLPIRGGVTVEL